MVGVRDGAEPEIGEAPEAVAPEEFSIGVIDPPRHAPIAPAAKFELIVQVYETGSLAPATLK